MNQLPLFIKRTPPQIHDVIQRRRLFDLIENAPSSGASGGMVWISGPLGAGKTSLAASYAHHHGKGLIWYGMDQSDQDFAVFMNHFGEVAASVVGQGRWWPKVSDDPRKLCSCVHELSERIAVGMDDGGLIVLDNYPLASDTTRMHILFLTVLASLPAAIKVLVTSRAAPPRELIRLVLEGRMRQIAWEDLRFDLGETKKLLDKHGFSREQLEMSHARADGWAAGLILLARGLYRGVQLESVTPWTPLQEMFDYLDVELFRKLQPELRQFLKKTAFLSEMTADMAQRASGCEQSGELLNWLFLHNSLVVRWSGPETRYSYHPLLSQFLRYMVANESSPGELDRLRADSAAILESVGEIEQALNLLWEARAYLQAGSVLSKNAAWLMENGRGSVLRKYLLALPREILGQDPWLLYWFGMCLQGEKQGSSEPVFQRAFQLFRQNNDVHGILYCWCAAMDHIVDEWDALDALDEWMDDLEQLVAQGLCIPDDELGLRCAATMVCGLAWRCPENSERIGEWLHKALPALAPGDDRIRPVACFHLAHYAVWQGDFELLQDIAKRSRQLLDCGKTSADDILKLQCILAAEQGLCLSQADAALASLEACVAATSEPDQKWRVVIHCMAILAALHAGKMEKAKDLLHVLQGAVSGTGRCAQSCYHFAVAAVSLFCQDYCLARQHARQAVAYADVSGARCAMPFFSLGLAHACFEIQEDDDARQCMDNVATALGDSCNPMLKFMWLASQAYFALDRDPRGAGLEELAEAFSLGRKEGYMHTFCLWRPDMLACLCATALKHGIEEDYARLLIRRHDLFPKHPPVAIQSWPWQVRISLLGRFELIRDDQPVRFTGKIQHRPLALLKMLAAQAEQGVTEEEIYDLLWPDSQQNQARSALTTTLSRLRKIMGSKDCILFQNHTLFLNPKLCWVDVTAFRACCLDLDAMSRPGTDTGKAWAEKSELNQMAFELYTGHLLPADMSHTWTIPVREELRQRFYTLVTTHGDFLESQGAVDQARECYQRALEVDDVQEEFYRRLMLCAQKMGRPDEARMCWELCRKRLATKLGMQPRADLCALAASLGAESGAKSHFAPDRGQMAEDRRQ
jgi:LuxR family transcriptional regulator, maltose regulon positive regulatory protein